MDLKEYAINGLVKRRHPWELARFAVVWHQIKGARSARPRTIYDIGCGDGWFAGMLKRKLPQCAVTAIDNALTPALMQELGSRRDGVRFLQGIPPQAPPADIVLLLDVVEHIERPQEILADIRQSGIAAAHTLLIITAPAFQHLYGEQDRWLGHYTRYTSGELAALAEGAGFEVKKAGYFFFSLLLVRRMQRKREREKERKREWYEPEVWLPCHAYSALCLDDGLLRIGQTTAAGRAVGVCGVPP